MKLDGSRGSSDVIAHPMKMASNINGAIHHTGVFLSWHRYALSLWEDALRDECGWRGGLAYWDWHRDTPEAGADWLQSPLFDTVSGYGGNGQRVNASAPAGGIAVGGTGGGCVLDGPFQNRTLSIGPMGQMLLNNTRCLTRNFNVKVAYMSASSKSMRKILGAKSMAESRQLAESSVESRRAMSKGGNIDSFGSMHSIGHVGIGGEASSLTLVVFSQVLSLTAATDERSVQFHQRSSVLSASCWIGSSLGSLAGAGPQANHGRWRSDRTLRYEPDDVGLMVLGWVCWKRPSDC